MQHYVIEFILGIPQYSRGVVGVADVATEVALADTATRTRNGRRIKMIEDAIDTLAHKVVGLYEEFLPPNTMLPIRLTDSQDVLKLRGKRWQCALGVTPRTRARLRLHWPFPTAPPRTTVSCSFRSFSSTCLCCLRAQLSIRASSSQAARPAWDERHSGAPRSAASTSRST
jgi:hypothetical protein